ncbi:MAG: DUF2079 domain-containing protein [Chloroflexota bacterium]
MIRLFNIYRILLILLLLLFTWIFTDLAWDLHNGMRTHKADLGQIAQAVWNSSQGRFVEMTDNGPLSTRMTDHVEPILAIISPVLWLWRDVKALLLLQVLLTAVGGWLLYELTLTLFDKLLTSTERTQIWHIEPLRQLTSPIALALVIGYLLSPQLQNALLTEFHAAPLAVPLILWAFLSIERQRWLQFTFSTLLTALVKEEMALLATGLGFWAMWKLMVGRLTAGRLIIDDLRLGSSHSPILTIGRAWQRVRGHRLTASPHSAELTSKPHPLILSLLVTLLSLTWFYLATFVIVPAYAVEVYETAENPYWARYGALGDSPVDIVRSFFTQPGTVWSIGTEAVRVNYLWMMLASFGFLSLLAPEILLLSLPLLLANLLSAYPPQYYGEFHYSAPLVAYFGVSGAYGGVRFWRLVRPWVKGSSPNFQYMAASSAGVMALAAFWHNRRTTLRPVLSLLLISWVLFWSIRLYAQEGRGPWGQRHDPTPITAHHQRLEHFIDQLPPEAAVTATAAVHPHVALRRFVYQFPIGMPQFDKKGEAEWALLDVTTNTDLASGDLRDMVMAMLASDWGVIDGADGFLLLRRGEAAKEIPAAFYDFTRSTASKTVEGNQPLTLSAIDVNDRPRWRATSVISEWSVGPGFAPERDEPQLQILRPDGVPVYSFDDATPPALIWYPPSKWQLGDQIRIATPALFLPQQWGVAVSERAIGTHSTDVHSGKDHAEISSEEANSVENGADLNGVHLSIGAEGRRWVKGYYRNHASFLGELNDPRTNGDALSDLLGMEGEKAGDSGLLTVRGAFDVTPFDGEIEPLWVQGQLGLNRVWVGGSAEVYLQWSRSGPWPSQLTPFVHLRQRGENRAQADGLPRWFLPYLVDWFATEGESAEMIQIVDWRQLSLPDENELLERHPNDQEKWQVVIGLYDAQSRQRAQVVDDQGNAIGNELVIGSFHTTARPIPDFTCALVPATCASQSAYAGRNPK